MNLLTYHIRKHMMGLPIIDLKTNIWIELKRKLKMAICCPHFHHPMLLSYMVSSFSSMADINSSAFMISASMSSISSESLINRKIRIIIADHCMLIKGFSSLVSRATCISAAQFECCWGYPAKSANGQDSPKTLPSWFSAKLNQARIWVSDFLITDNK